MKAVTMSEEAVSHALRLRSQQDQNIRLYLAGKGCAGFSYGVAFSEKDAKDLCFAQEVPKGERSLDLLVDPDTLVFVQGSHIIWKESDEGKGFVVQNPQAKKLRGKFFNRPDWKEKLNS